MKSQSGKSVEMGVNFFFIENTLSLIFVFSQIYLPFSRFAFFYCNYNYTLFSLGRWLWQSHVVVII